MRLYLSTLSTPIGLSLIVTDGAGTLRALDFEDYRPRMDRLLRRHYGAVDLTDAPLPGPVAQALSAYFDGDLTAPDSLPTATNGTIFQARVWAELRRLRPGETLSYGSMSARIGQPKAVRAMGLANGANPIAIVVPCHRVIGANGALTGYGGGLHRKEWLLRHEGADFRN
ncbi:methylated-DNA--[protein]-cysteine S-methyltransferase [Niveispirillum sp.]|uniref:methylated-DNA--[protein]-cysteine S-methyltransferase n=1 Tax=Niveispirillum sp. TaxID=1917217 RepID=UPI001B7C4C27|nr:methylated-DNA--[protein]-cysteine S-methyltransferase [Niveispirillum sp.]MBP7338781.1 methylated-DNA--[protein]-cysteine S-methyltransferase [Niveispirillum sp.]